MSISHEEHLRRIQANLDVERHHINEFVAKWLNRFVDPTGYDGVVYSREQCRANAIGGIEMAYFLGKIDEGEYKNYLQRIALW